MPSLGAAATLDVASLQFYATANAGTYNLAMGNDANFATCDHCVLVLEDASSSGVARYYFQSGGSLVIKAGSSVLDGTVHATLTNVTLVEVTIDQQSATSTPVPNGACLHITSAPVDVVWTCDPSYFNDNGCDCGCGAVDFDCADETAASCEFCNDTGSCSATDCPGTINPTNNAVCTP